MATQAAQIRVKPIPDGYQTLTSYLVVDNTRALMDFLKKAFNATELFSMNDESGIPRHAEMKVGTSMIMLGRAHNEYAPTKCTLYVYVEDVDAVYEKAIAAGGKSIQEIKNQFYGDRSGAVEDPCGNSWWIATHIEDVSMEELKRRSQEAQKS